LICRLTGSICRPGCSSVVTPRASLSPSSPNMTLLTLSATEVAGIHASTLILFAWVGIPLLRFHLHPSHRRSIGQTIGLTAYPPQRAAIFMMLPHSNLPRLFSVGSLIRAFGHPNHMWSLLALAGLYDSTPNIPWMRSTFKRSLTPRLKSGACARANLGQRTYRNALAARFIKRMTIARRAQAPVFRHGVSEPSVVLKEYIQRQSKK